MAVLVSEDFESVMIPEDLLTRGWSIAGTIAIATTGAYAGAKCLEASLAAVAPAEAVTLWRMTMPQQTNASFTLAVKFSTLPELNCGCAFLGFQSTAPASLPCTAGVINDDGTPKWALMLNNGWIPFTPVTPLQANRWYVMKLTYSTNGTVSTATLSIDGTQILSGNPSVAYPVDSCFFGAMKAYNPTGWSVGGIGSFDNILVESIEVPPPPPPPVPWLLYAGLAVAATVAIVLVVKKK